MTDNNGICIIPNCGREIKPKVGERGYRGLCKACAVIANRSIRRGKVTAEQLVEMGLMLPLSNGAYGRLRSPFSLALKARLEGK